MSAEILIQAMEEEDIPGVQNMFIRLYDHLTQSGFAFALNRDYLPQYLSLQLDNRLSRILVLYENGTPAGFIGISAPLINRKFLFHGAKLTGMIQELYVEKAYRGRGYAGRLLKEAEHFFQSLGVTIVQVNTVAGNETARNFYQKQGFYLEYSGLSKQLSADTNS